VPAHERRGLRCTPYLQNAPRCSSELVDRAGRLAQGGHELGAYGGISHDLAIRLGEPVEVGHRYRGLHLAERPAHLLGKQLQRPIGSGSYRQHS